MRKALLMGTFAVIALTMGCANTTSSEKTTLSWWDTYGSRDGTDVSVINAIEKFENANPDIAIERVSVPFSEMQRKLLLAMVGGELPDIMIVDNPNHQALAAAGALADLTSFVEEWGEGDLYFEGPWESTMYQGRNYGLPFGSNNLALFYNEEVLADIGVDPPETWDELMETAEALTETDINYPLSVAAVQSEEGSFQFLPFLWQAGGDLDQLRSGETAEALSFWKDMIDQGYMSREVLTLNQQDVAMQFVNGSTAMMVNGTWQVEQLRDSLDFDWGVVPLPAKEKQATAIGGENFAIGSSSDHIEEAWQVLSFLQEEEVLLEMVQAKNYLPAREDLIENPYWQDDEYYQAFATSMEFARPRAYGEQYPAISNEVQNMIQGVLSGSQEMDEAINRTATEVEALFELNQ